MSKLLVAAVAVGAIAAFNLAPQPAQAPPTATAASSNLVMALSSLGVILHS